MPTVSVVVPSYNHAAYLPEMIDSVLNQTYADWELVIVDDGSSDDSAEIIRRYRDPRIRFYAFQENRGAVAALNYAISESRGSYIASLNSDDVMLPCNLERKIDYLNRHPNAGLVFSKPLLIDEESRPVLQHHIGDLFVTGGLHQGKWLRHLFDRGNCFCHSSVVVRKECFTRCGNFNPLYDQLPDFDLWLRMILHDQTAVLEEPLVAYRVDSRKVSVSAASHKTYVRTRWEYAQILKNYLQLDTVEKYLEVFPEDTVTDEVPIQFFLAKRALGLSSTISPVYAHFGLEILQNLLGDEAVRKQLADKQGYTLQSFKHDKANHLVFCDSREKVHLAHYPDVLVDKFVGRYAVRISKQALHTLT